jgi:peptidoglycan-N-acetylglucosamine deacetylase
VTPLVTAIIAVLVLLPALYLLVPHLVKNILRLRFARAARASGFKYLTFDDGPDPQTTPRILELLARHGVKATFFLVGERAERHPALVREILSQGHQVGEHGYRHLHPWTTRPLAYLRELRQSGRAARGWAGTRSRVLFRPPFGKLNLFTMAYVIASGRRLAFWDIDPRDYEAPSPDATAARVMERWNHGAVVLLHDGRMTPGTSSPDLTVGALTALLEKVGSGTRFRTVGGMGGN